MERAEANDGPGFAVVSLPFSDLWRLSDATLPDA